MILDDIVVKKRERLKERLNNKFDYKDNKPYIENIFRKEIFSNKFTIIAEFKKASPSKGIIAPEFDVKEVLKVYEGLPIGAYSVLTEEDFFKGSDEYLQYVASNTVRPALRKDFIIDKYQIYEAKYLGASAVLLIVAVLKDTIKEFYDLCIELGIAPLVEVHNREELDIALKAGVDIIGINNRDLKTFKVDLNTTKELIKYIPSNVKVISESGIQSIDDIKMLKSLGVSGVLIGETLMRNLKNEEMLNELKEFLGDR